MELIRKIFFAIIGIFALFFATGIFIAEKYEKVIINYFIKDINKFVASEIRINKVDVTFIKKFPNISVWLKNTYIESQDKTYGDTLIFVEDIYLQFDALKLLKKDFEIKSVDLTNGLCNLNISSTGEKNFIFWVKQPANKETKLDLKLNKIKLTNISINYNNQPKLFNSNIYINSTLLSGKINDKHWSFDVTQDITLKRFKLKNSDYINSDKEIQTNLSISNDSLDLRINNGQITLEKTKYLINGNIENIKNPVLDLAVTGNGININDALTLLYKSETIKPSKIKSNGNIDFNASIKGKMTHNQLPHLSGDFNLKNGEIVYKKEKLHLKNINLDGEFDNHNKKILDYSALVINNLSYTIDDKTSNGKLLIENFHKPKIQFEISGGAPLKLIEKIFLGSRTSIKNTDGQITYNLIFSGKFNTFKKISKKDIREMDIKGNIQLSDCNVQLNNEINSINNINALLNVDKITSVQNLSFTINKNDFLVNGKINNLNDYLLKNEQLKAHIELFSNNIDITDFIHKSNNEKNSKTTTTNNKIELTDKLDVNGNFVLNNFMLTDFTAQNCRGKLRYRNRILTLNSVFFESMEGNINGGGVLAQTTDKNFSIKAQSNLNNINISKMMKSFHNFGQEIINENQISGELTGSITISTRLFNNFNIDKNSIFLDSYMEINNGRLANFTPLMGLSKFFKSSELADIHFSRFENSIAISDKTIYFTDMKINSSVTDLLGSGIHGFDNSYEYKVKIKLSEILSGKNDKPEITKTPFGEIEKEEMKGTYIPIKISGTGDSYKVTPDFDETKKSIKTNVEQEKQTLKSIFREEFGNSKTDSTSKNDTIKKKKPTFKIEWEEEDN